VAAVAAAAAVAEAAEVAADTAVIKRALEPIKTEGVPQAPLRFAFFLQTSCRFGMQRHRT
jgi:hypothetical protein